MSPEDKIRLISPPISTKENQATQAPVDSNLLQNEDTHQHSLADSNKGTPHTTSTALTSSPDSSDSKKCISPVKKFKREIIL